MAGHDEERGGARALPGWSRWALSGLILAVPLVLIALSFWPGRMNADTLNEITEAKTGRISDYHAPILTGLWHLVYNHGVGPGWVLALQLLVFLAGTFLVLRSAMPAVLAAVAASVVALSPPVFGLLGLVGRDAWFLAALVLSFGALAGVASTAGRTRVAWIVVALVAAWFSLAARQNAAAGTVVVTVVLVALLVSRRGGAWSKKRGAAVLAGGVAVTLALMASQVVVVKLIDPLREYPATALYVYDLAGQSLDDDTNLFPRTVIPGGTPARIRGHWIVDDVVPMLAGPGHPIVFPFRERDNRAIAKAWRHELLADPIRYLRGRGELFLRQITITRAAKQTYHPFIDQNPFGYVTSSPSANRVANDYQEAFADDAYDGDAIYSVWAYLLVALVLAVILLRRRRWPDVLLGATALAALLYQSGIFFGGTGTTYRFEFPPVTLSLIVVAALVGRWLAGVWKTRRRSVTNTMPDAATAQQA